MTTLNQSPRQGQPLCSSGVLSFLHKLLEALRKRKKMSLALYVWSFLSLEGVAVGSFEAAASLILHRKILLL